MSTSRLPFNIIDEGFAHADDAAEPLTVQIEARSNGHLDVDRLHRAVVDALGRHPLARARMEPWVDDQLGYEWIVDDATQIDPFRSVATTPGDRLDDVRAEFYSRPLSLFESPPLRVLHVEHPDGDCVMVSIHHSASDGMGALRFLQSICRAYAGTDDPDSGVDPEAARMLAVPTDPPSLDDSFHRAKMDFQRLVRQGALPARLSPSGATTKPGYGVVTRTVAVGPLVAAPLRAATGASVNDLLLTATSCAAGRWIEQEGDRADRVSIQMPMNARPAEWSRDVVANLVTVDAVSTSSAERQDVEACLRAVANWTEAVKRQGSGPALVALAAVPRSGVLGRRMVAQWAIQAGAAFAETLVLSNLGRIPDDFADTGTDAKGLDLAAVHFSPPAPMPLGLGIGAAATGDQLVLTLRHRWALWSDEAAQQFADLLLEELNRFVEQ